MNKRPVMYGFRAQRMTTIRIKLLLLARACQQVCTLDWHEQSGTAPPAPVSITPSAREHLVLGRSSRQQPR